jgi:FkbM family methyltransferase
MNFVSGFIRRIIALRGFRYLGLRWLRPYFAYLLKPLIDRWDSSYLIDISGLTIRTQTADLYILGNLFYDYDIESVLRDINACDFVVDAGANIGAFTWLLLQLGCKVPIVAIEPEINNYKLLSSQNFGDQVNCIQAALGTEKGKLWLRPSESSAGHTTSDEIIDQNVGYEVDTVTLTALCSGRTFVKMDIEGGEYNIIKSGIPKDILFMHLEWHFKEDLTNYLLDGNWFCFGKEDGASYWRWARNS